MSQEKEILHLIEEDLEETAGYDLPGRLALGGIVEIGKYLAKNWEVDLVEQQKKSQAGEAE